jgi:hypothetical protein
MIFFNNAPTLANDIVISFGGVGHDIVIVLVI